jgi:hypothetical protein
VLVAVRVIVRVLVQVIVRVAGGVGGLVVRHRLLPVEPSEGVTVTDRGAGRQALLTGPARRVTVALSAAAARARARGRGRARARR